MFYCYGVLPVILLYPARFWMYVIHVIHVIHAVFTFIYFAIDWGRISYGALHVLNVDLSIFEADLCT